MLTLLGITFKEEVKQWNNVINTVIAYYKIKEG
jgi:hypothetical protein